MKISIAQQNYHIGNFEENTEKILGAIELAKKEGADLILFSEMSVCGYPARDFVEFDDFITKCYESIDTIRKAADTIGVLIGSPARNPGKKGKDLFNAAFFLYEQKIVAEIHKTLLPTYDVFDENRYFEAANANLCGALPMFTSELSFYTCNDDGTIKEPIIEPASRVPSKELNPATLVPDLNIDQIYQALVLGIRDYFTKMGFTKAILGSSGGIDSAVTLAIAADALGAQNVLAVLMPSEYSTEHSVDDAVLLSKNLDNPYHIVPIKNVYHSFLETLDPIFNGMPFSLAEENIQSRSRGNILMAIANKLGYVLLNTSNKSELATGYGTLYGDMAGGLGVLGDLYKIQVYELAKYINREKEIIPTNIITKAPSAELRPDQKDSDSLPDYSVLDQILYQYIEKRANPSSIVAMGFSSELVNRTLKMVNTNEYKRNQFCPIIRVSPKAFGVGRRMPIVGKYL